MLSILLTYFFEYGLIDRFVKLTITEPSCAPSLSKIESGEIPQSKRDEEIAFQSGRERLHLLEEEEGSTASSSGVHDTDECDVKTLKTRWVTSIFADE